MERHNEESRAFPERERAPQAPEEPTGARPERAGYAERKEAGRPTETVEPGPRTAVNLGPTERPAAPAEPTERPAGAAEGAGAGATEERGERADRAEPVGAQTYGPAEAPEERQAVRRPEQGAESVAEPTAHPEQGAGAPAETAGRPDRSPTPDQSAPVTNFPETATTARSERPGVLGREDTDAFMVRWETIQARFIDDPRAATQEADSMVGEVMDRMARLRQEHHAELRGALEQGGDTEGLRLALQRYRAFFQSLLGA